MPTASAALCLAPGLSQRPWRVEAADAARLAGDRGLSLDGLLLETVGWLARSTGLPALAAVASGSGALLLAPALPLGAGRPLNAAQVLVAQCFFYPEPEGLSHICGSEVPKKVAADLLRELACLRHTRWVEQPCGPLQRVAENLTLVDAIGDGGG